MSPPVHGVYARVCRPGNHVRPQYVEKFIEGGSPAPESPRSAHEFTAWALCCRWLPWPRPIARRLPDRRRCARARAGGIAAQRPRTSVRSAAASSGPAAPALGEGGSILPRARQLRGKEISLRFPSLRADGARLGSGARGAAGNRWAPTSFRALLAVEGPQARAAAHVLGADGRWSAGGQRKGIPQT